jgi:hypothetical protein
MCRSRRTAAEFFYESPDVVAVPIVPQGELIPKEEESYNHTARTCRVGPDNKLYITLGQPFNVPAPEALHVVRRDAAICPKSAANRKCPALRKIEWITSSATARRLRPPKNPVGQ